MHNEDDMVLGLSRENLGASELDSSVDREPSQKQGDRSDSSIMF